MFKVGDRVRYVGDLFGGKFKNAEGTVEAVLYEDPFFPYDVTFDFADTTHPDNLGVTVPLSTKEVEAI